MASLNTGNNLLYLLLALLLALLVLQNVLAEWHFRGLSLGRRLPAEAFVGEDAQGVVWVHNHRRALSAFSLVINEEDVDAQGAVSWVAAGGQVQVPVTYRFQQRGRRSLKRLSVSSSFPFGLFTRKRTLSVEAEMVVFPSRRRGVALAEPVAQGEESADPHRKGGSEDFLGLRSFETGDSIRRIHWPSSAKLGRLLIVERSQARSEAVVVQLRSGKDQEVHLERACGQADRHAGRGQAGES